MMTVKDVDPGYCNTITLNMRCACVSKTDPYTQHVQDLYLDLL